MGKLVDLRRLEVLCLRQGMVREQLSTMFQASCASNRHHEVLQKHAGRRCHITGLLTSHALVT